MDITMANNLKRKDDDEISISSTGSVVSVMAHKFKKFLETKKVQKATTVEEVRRAMNPSIREEEDAFWSYVERKARRNQTKGIPLNNVEILSRKNQSQPLGKGEVTSKMPMIEEDAIIYNDPDYFTEDICEERYNSLNMLFSRTTRSVEEVSVKTGQSALTDVTLVSRMYNPVETDEAMLMEMMMSAPIPPEDLRTGLPLCFDVCSGDTVNPYGFKWQDARYNDMCAYLRTMDNAHRDNVQRIQDDETSTKTQKDSRVSGEEHKFRKKMSRAVAILMWYINHFKVYLKNTHQVLEVIYNRETGIVDGVYNVCDLKGELTDDEMVGKLPNAKKSTDTMMNLWKQHPGRPRVYDEVFKIAPARKGPVYNAPGISNQWFNTFFGFRVDREFDLDVYPVKYAHDRFDISPITNHITEKYLDGNAGHIRWFKRWLYEILWLKKRTGVAVVFYGEQGTGKTLIVDNFIGQKIIGQSAGDSHCVYKKIDNMEGFGGQFNSTFQEKLLINLDEVSNARKHDCQLKAMITNTINESEQKYRDRTTKTNYTNLWITSNEERAFIKITPDDRRYFVKRVNRWWTCGRPGNIKQYFDDLGKCIEHPRAIAEFMLWIKEAENYDIDVCNIPVTDDKLMFIAENVDLTWKWINEVVEHRDDVFIPGQVIEQQAFVDAYNNKYGERYRASPQMFTKIFKTLGFDFVSRHPLKVKCPPREHIIETMMSLNKWVDT